MLFTDQVVESHGNEARHQYDGNRQHGYADEKLNDDTDKSHASLYGEQIEYHILISYIFFKIDAALIVIGLHRPQEIKEITFGIREFDRRAPSEAAQSLESDVPSIG